MCFRLPGLLILMVVLAVSLVLLTIGVGRQYFPALPNRVAVLNHLRDEINRNYGFDDHGTPRINCGPCGRFAVVFRERWNARFRETPNIACVMSPDRSYCGHVVLKFRDNTFFDGGNGPLSEQQLLAIFPKCWIEEMIEFDQKLLDERVGGLKISHYPLCPNYSDDLTAAMIDKHLALLPNPVK
jgi:hypothetical protein